MAVYKCRAFYIFIKTQSHIEIVAVEKSQIETSTEYINLKILPLNLPLM